MYNPLKALFEDLKTHRFHKGEILLSPDEEPRGVYFLKSGYIKAYTINKVGETQIVVLSGPGSIFPFLWAFHSGAQQLFF